MRTLQGLDLGEFVTAVQAGYGLALTVIAVLVIAAAILALLAWVRGS